MMVNTENFFEVYTKKTPLALAIERSYECEILSRQQLRKPILDVGVGDGIFASVLFKESIDLGIDPNEKELERARATEKYKELLKCTGDSVPRPDGSFRTILANSVLEHIPDIDSVLKEMARLLDRDGHIYLTLPTDRFDQYTLIYQLLKKFRLRGLAKRYRKFFNRFWAHYHFHSPKDWAQLFEKNGLTVVQSIVYDSPKSCFFNNLLAFFALPSAICRRLLNRWFFIPSTRPIVAPILTALSRHVRDRNPLQGSESGGLVFFELRKREIT